jgi:hypothetical protein
MMSVFVGEMITGSAFLLSHPNGYDQSSYPDHYWLYGLLFLIAYLSLVYVPWAIVVTVTNIRFLQLNDSVGGFCFWIGLIFQSI